MPKRWIALLGCLMFGSSCSATHSLRGVPAAYMPSEYQAESREGKATIDLSLLQRSQPDQYRIEAGDVLAIYAPGLLGLVDTQPDQPRGDNPPINLPMTPVDRPSLGFPVTVRDDNTIQIPQLPALNVYGLTEREVEDRLRQAVQQAGLLANDTQPRIVVSIFRQRTYRITVYRQESATAPTSTMTAGAIDIGRAGKGASRTVDLRAYENDVAHALAQPGVDGLPGLDAKNVIHVIRARNARKMGAYPVGFGPQPTPLARNVPRQIVRGQSPSRSWGQPASTGQGPFAYMTASQFNLSGRDVAQGSTGPALIEPLPGTPAPSHGGAGYGHSAPSGEAFRNPTYSPRSSAGPTGARFAPTQSPVQSAPVSPASYMPVQYTAPQLSVGPQMDPWPTQNNTNPTPVMESPVMQRYPANVPQMAPMETQPHMGAMNSNMSEPVGAGHVGFGVQPPAYESAMQHFDPTVEGNHVIKIPVRLAPGETLDITEEDITLYDGDIIFIENRDTDVYFIGGLLGGGQYPLPRDRDLHVLEAVSLAQGQNSRQAGSQGLQSSGGVSALNRDIVPSASRLLILRQVGCNRQMTVEVDLYKALRFPHENILVQPSDMLILQYTPYEAVGAFVQRNIFEGALLGLAAGSFQSGN